MVIHFWAAFFGSKNGPFPAGTRHSLAFPVFVSQRYFLHKDSLYQCEISLGDSSSEQRISWLYHFSFRVPKVLTQTQVGESPNVARLSSSIFNWCRLGTGNLQSYGTLLMKSVFFCWLNPPNVYWSYSPSHCEDNPNICLKIGYCTPFFLMTLIISQHKHINMAIFWRKIPNAQTHKFMLMNPVPPIKHTPKKAWYRGYKTHLQWYLDIFGTINHGCLIRTGDRIFHRWLLSISH